MDLSKYIKLINKLARNLKNKKLDPKDIPAFMEKELGYKVEIDRNYKPTDMEEIKRQRAEQIFSTKYNELHTTFVKLLDTFIEIKQKKYDPFTIKYQSFKVTEHFNTLKKYKEDDNYEKVLLQAVIFYTKTGKGFDLNDEHVKVLRREYLY